jgi:hypothetical protein
MIYEADRDNDGQISIDEFIRVMKKRSDNPLGTALLSVHIHLHPILTCPLLSDDWDSDED